MLSIQTTAPDFTLPNQDGDIVRLSDTSGSWRVLYFYARDSTAGCTSQAKAFMDLIDEYAFLGVEIIGVSKDSVASHKRFQEKVGITYTLLSDEELEVLNAYEVWQPRKRSGKVVYGCDRTTYVIDPAGTIVWAKTKVKAKDNPAEVLAFLRETL